MLIGYAHVSKSDCSQTLDLQRDTDTSTLQMAMAALKDPKSVAARSSKKIRNILIQKLFRLEI